MFTRRAFLKTLAALGLWSGARNAWQSTRSVVLLETCVAGFRYYEGPQVQHRLHAGQPLVLCRELTNPYDDRAIALYTTDGAKLGYIPRADNSVLAALLDQGASLQATITDIVCEAPPWERVRFRVTMILGA
ncbi:MAG: HIRAN domain-containing protein [Rhodothermus sp.]|nr:HIRAN domain-containing protein [Rhodothermus sp.]